MSAEKRCSCGFPSPPLSLSLSLSLSFVPEIRRPTASTRKNFHPPKCTLKHLDERSGDPASYSLQKDNENVALSFPSDADAYAKCANKDGDATTWRNGVVYRESVKSPESICFTGRTQIAIPILKESFSSYLNEKASRFYFLQNVTVTYRKYTVHIEAILLSERVAIGHIANWSI